jgi:hypothetical protein
LFTQALALVEEETRRYRPTKNYLEYLSPANYSSFEVIFLHQGFILKTVLLCFLHNFAD